MKISKLSNAAQASVATPSEGAAKKSAAAPADVAAAVDSFERPSAAELKNAARFAALTTNLPDLDDRSDADVRSENIRAQGALYSAARLEETKLLNVPERLVELFGTGMLPIGGGRSLDEATRAAAHQRLSEAVGHAAAQVRSDPKAFVEADGAVKPQLGELVRGELHAAGGRRQDAALAESSWAVLGSLPEGDIEALAFLVLMQAAKSAQEDLKAIMKEVKGINETKSEQRERLDAVRTEAAATSGESGASSTGETDAEGARRLELAVARGPRIVRWPPE